MGQRDERLFLKHTHIYTRAFSVQEEREMRAHQDIVAWVGIWEQSDTHTRTHNSK
jgi:hypothetical protein